MEIFCFGNSNSCGGISYSRIPNAINCCGSLGGQSYVLTTGGACQQCNDCK